MIPDQIKRYNEALRGYYVSRKKEVEALREKIIKPCEFCSYEGIHKCLDCQEDFYKDFKERT